MMKSSSSSLLEKFRPALRGKRESMADDEASWRSLVVGGSNFEQKSTLNSARTRAFRARFLSGSFHLCTKPLMHFL